MRVAKRNQLRGRAQALPWESVKARLVEQAGQHMGQAARCLAQKPYLAFGLRYKVHCVRDTASRLRRTWVLSR